MQINDIIVAQMPLEIEENGMPLVKMVVLKIAQILENTIVSDNGDTIPLHRIRKIFIKNGMVKSDTYDEERIWKEDSKVEKDAQ